MCINEWPMRRPVCCSRKYGITGGFVGKSFSIHLFQNSFILMKFCTKTVGSTVI